MEGIVACRLHRMMTQKQLSGVVTNGGRKELSNADNDEFLFSFDIVEATYGPFPSKLKFNILWSMLYLYMLKSIFYGLTYKIYVHCVHM